MVFILLWLVSIYVKKEGFGSAEDSAHSAFTEKYAQKYSNIGVALSATKNEKVLGGESIGIFGNVNTILGMDGSLEQNVENPYPVEGDRSGMYAIIDKCQAVKAVDCNVFDRADFSASCGMCLDIGTDSENKPATGGLVLTQSDREYGKSQQVGNSLPPYSPTVGTCPAGKFVSSKSECIVLKNRLDCAKGSTFGEPTGCSQCYGDTSYTIVNPEDAYNPNPDLIKGYGTLTLLGEGNLNYKQAGDSSFTTVRLTTKKPIVIALEGPEYENTLTLNVTPDPTPVVYDPARAYAIDDRVIFKGSVFTMVEAAGAAGFAPDRKGDKLWKRPGISLSEYKPPPPVYLMGYLQGQTRSGDFNVDIHKLIISDSYTGRKPRATGSTVMNGVDVIKMAAGFGQNSMSLTMRPVFTFVDNTSDEAISCPNTPFLTKAASSTLLESDACYKKGSRPGNFSLECLQNMFMSNGCLNSGKGYPSNAQTAAKLMIDDKGETRTLNAISSYIYEVAVLTSTGNDINGVKVDMADWSTASEFCTGKTIMSPCDTSTRDTGPLTPECLIYLWDNRGENNPEGPTYHAPPNSRSLFSKGRTNRFCTRMGSLSPMDKNDTSNVESLAYWQAQGGVAAVKEAMKNIHKTANSTTMSEDAKRDSMIQCYGFTPSNNAATFETNWQSSSTSDNLVDVIGKDMGCWNDSGDRMFKGSNQGRPFTPESCAAKARELGHKYSAVQDGNECYTGNDRDNWKRYGRAGGACPPTGGGWKAHVYDVSSSSIPDPSKIVLSQGIKLKSGIKFPEGYNYSLTFDITPKGYISDYGNIFRISNTANSLSGPYRGPSGFSSGAFWNAGDRCPFIAFTPNNTSLYVILGDTQYGNWGPGAEQDTFPPLPLDKKSSVSITTSDKNVTISAGGRTSTYKQPSTRQAGNDFTLWGSDPFFPSADAIVENVQLKVNGSIVYTSPTPVPYPPPPPPRERVSGVGWNY